MVALYLPNGEIYTPEKYEDIEKIPWQRKMGGTGLHQFSGYITEEFLNELTGKRGANYFEQMRRNDVAIGTIYTSISMLIRSCQASVSSRVPVSEQTETHEKSVKFYEECLEDMQGTIEDLIDDANTCIYQGYALSEFTFKVRDGKDSDFNDGKLGIKCIEPRSQLSLENWVFNEETHECVGFMHAPEWGMQTVFIPLRKCLHFRTTRERNNPEGYSFIRNCVRSYKQVNVIQYAEGIGAERNLAGLPIITMPLGATSVQDYEQAKTLVEKVRRDEYAGIVLPPPKGMGEDYRWKFELISSHNVGAGIDTDKIISRLHSEMMQSTLINFLGSTSASYASGRVQGDFFQVAVSSILSSYEREINEKLSKTLFKMNNFPGLEKNEYPVIKLSPISQRNLEAVRNLIRDMAMAGFIDNQGPDIENWIRGILDLPTITQEDYDERMKQKEIETEKMLAREQEMARISTSATLQKTPKNVAAATGAKTATKGLSTPRGPQKAGKPPTRGGTSAKRADGPTAGA